MSASETKHEAMAETDTKANTNAAGLKLVRESPAAKLKKQREEEAAAIVADAEAKAAAIVADAEAIKKQAESEQAEDLAAEAAQRALEAGGNEKPGKITKAVAKRLAEPAAERATRLNYEIADAEQRDAQAALEIEAMAIECEAGDPEALIARRALRAERNELAEKIADKKAALALAMRQVEQDRAVAARQFRERAIDSADLPLTQQESFAAQLELKLVEIARLCQGIKHCDSIIAGIVHPYATVESQLLLGLSPRTLETVIVARLAHLGVIAQDMAPGGNIAHAPSVYDVVKQNAEVARGLLARYRETPTPRSYTTHPIPVWNAQHKAIYTAGPLIEPERAPG